MNKIILIAIALFSLSFTSIVIANNNSVLCDGYDFCIKKERKKVFFIKNTYLARGFGETCSAAKKNANNTFKREFGEINHCGMFNGPYKKGSCSQTESGDYSQWIQCPPASKPLKSKKRGSCVGIGGRIFC